MDVWKMCQRALALIPSTTTSTATATATTITVPNTTNTTDPLDSANEGLMSLYLLVGRTVLANALFYCEQSRVSKLIPHRAEIKSPREFLFRVLADTDPGVVYCLPPKFQCNCPFSSAGAQLCSTNSTVDDTGVDGKVLKHHSRPAKYTTLATGPTPPSTSRNGTVR
ncbi:hypothetical protein AYI68_g5718 [Smittium mucronatum]|uniref:Uncharacterized protein n=1 Tax=Smittium mucronatum TaxID=133383 RepID=A0A1R0GTI2_9FUNG|nr:hypothetical protein AYI68_g5718 [Smittium mucronatum]